MTNTIMFNATTSERMNSILDFVDLYSHMYYFQTSRKVEKRIEEYLERSDLNQEDFLNIFAWKTNWINHKLSEYNDGFVYNGNKDDNTKWEIDLQNGTARAITRYGLIDKDSKTKLYKFLTTLVNLQNKKMDAKTLLDEMAKAAPEGIGTVYLIAFLYFITHGKEPIYDVFSMKALDALYPGADDDIMEDKYDIKEVVENNSRLGAYVKLRELPQKEKNGKGGFSHLFDKKKYYGGSWSKYEVYKKKLKMFVEEYNKERIEKGLKSVTYAKCRDIDRALWVYGHLFEMKNAKSC